MNWEKFFKIGGSVAAFIVLVGTVLGGINWYIENKYVPRTEIEGYYQNLQQNNKVILDVLKTVGVSFFDATLIDIDTAVEALVDLPELTAEQKQQLDTLRLMKSNLIRERNVIEEMELNNVNPFNDHSN